jgi:hypothetical protein
MEWIVLEAFVALVIGVGIVWWTMGARKKTPADKSDGRDGNN